MNTWFSISSFGQVHQTSSFLTGQFFGGDNFVRKVKRNSTVRTSFCSDSCQYFITRYLFAWCGTQAFAYPHVSVSMWPLLIAWWEFIVNISALALLRSDLKNKMPFLVQMFWVANLSPLSFRIGITATTAWVLADKLRVCFVYTKCEAYKWTGGFKLVVTSL